MELSEFTELTVTLFPNCVSSLIVLGKCERVRFRFTCRINSRPTDRRTESHVHSGLLPHLSTAHDYSSPLSEVQKGSGGPPIILDWNFSSAQKLAIAQSRENRTTESLQPTSERP